jgi:hypothetical protein
MNIISKPGVVQALKVLYGRQRHRNKLIAEAQRAAQRAWRRA